MGIVVSSCVLAESFSYRLTQYEVFVVEHMRKENRVMEVRTLLRCKIVVATSSFQEAFCELGRPRVASSRNDDLPPKSDLRIADIPEHHWASWSPEATEVFTPLHPVRRDVNDGNTLRNSHKQCQKLIFGPYLNVLALNPHEVEHVR